MTSQQKSLNQDSKKVANNDNIVFVDDERDVKAERAEAAVEITSNTIEEKKKKTENIVLNNRNFIEVPPNCPPGQKPDKDGVCRDVF